MNAPLAKCPNCGTQNPWDVNNKYRPFCSERCKTIDLGAWANESYRVPLVEKDPNAESFEAPEVLSQ